MLISVDITPVQERVKEARRSAEEAVAAQQEAQVALVKATSAAEEARRELKQALELEQTILSYAVTDPDATAAPRVSVVDNIDPEIPTVDTLSPLGTRDAVITTLSLHPDRVYSMEQLVSYMRRLGYTGTNNAVHVQLSRMTTDQDPRVERVRSGFYRAGPSVRGSMIQPVNVEDPTEAGSSNGSLSLGGGGHLESVT